MNKNLDLFLTFMKIGAFTFGGGYAMIPLIQREVCDDKHWLNEDDILEVVAIAESTPGPVAINAATFVGSRTAGTLGAVCATLGVVLPSFLIILPIFLILPFLYENISPNYGYAANDSFDFVIVYNALIGSDAVLKKDTNEALIMLFEQLNKLGDISVLAPVFESPSSAAKTPFAPNSFPSFPTLRCLKITGPGESK